MSSRLPTGHERRYRVVRLDDSHSRCRLTLSCQMLTLRLLSPRLPEHFASPATGSASFFPLRPRGRLRSRFASRDLPGGIRKEPAVDRLQQLADTEFVDAQVVFSRFPNERLMDAQRQPDRD